MHPTDANETENSVYPDLHYLLSLSVPILRIFMVLTIKVSMLNPTALRTAKTLLSFGRSECNRVNSTFAESSAISLLLSPFFLSETINLSSVS